MEDGKRCDPVVEVRVGGEGAKENNLDLGHRGLIIIIFAIRFTFVVYARLNYSRTNLITFAVTSDRSRRDGTA